MTTGAGRTWLCTLLACATFVAPRAQAQVEKPHDQVDLPEHGTFKIERSVRVAKGNWLRAPVSAQGSSDGTAGVMLAEGLHDATIDLRGVVLRGEPEGCDPNTLRGYGLVLRDCDKVTVIGGTIGGYRGCIVAERCTNLTLQNVHFDGWFAQRLLSTPVAENQADWLTPHDNDAGEWLARYGAAISLTECERATVNNCRGRHGQNGVLLTRCKGAKVYDCDFSFLSGWGIALYRSSDNVLAKNRCDYCVRGYSHGVYWRGQDSAAILLFERCCDNLIAQNSATHSGDGLFMFAGRDLVDGKAAARGEQAPGGCDRNTIFRNDFSYAVANGIEITFSAENRVLENYADGCRQHALWGGYSSRMLMVGNSFTGAQAGGVTIEHGQECCLARNVLEHCETALELYWDDDPEFIKGPFGQKHDTASRDHWIVGNSFAENDADLAIEKTTGLVFQENVFAPKSSELLISAVTFEPGQKTGDKTPRDLLRGIAEHLPSGHIAHSTLRIAGADLPPELVAAFAFEAPLLPGVSKPFDPARLQTRGLDAIVIGEWGPWDFESGDERPVARKPGGVLAAATWSARWFSWDKGPDPRGTSQDLEHWRALAQTPIVAADVGAWTSPWAGRDEIQRAVGENKVGLVARSEVELPAGGYIARTTSDDGVRLRIDGASVIDNWTWHAATTDEGRVTLAAGKHVFELEWFQIDGGAALTLDLERAQ
jgi:hypothetical protein